MVYFSTGSALRGHATNAATAMGGKLTGVGMSSANVGAAPSVVVNRTGTMQAAKPQRPTRKLMTISGLLERTTLPLCA